MAPAETESTALLLELHELLRSTFRRLLLETPEAKSARQILANWGISQQIQEEFSLGYAPADRNYVGKFLRDLGYSPEILGLCGFFARGRPESALFVDRLMVPITNHQGQPIAFAGFGLQSQGPRWLNSAETPIFRRPETLFAWDKAAASIRQTGEVIVCEGYQDVLTLHSGGTVNAVCSVGSAFGPNHAALIKGAARRVVFAFDDDTAGRQAAEAACAIATEAGLEARAERKV